MKVCLGSVLTIVSLAHSASVNAEVKRASVQAGTFCVVFVFATQRQQGRRGSNHSQSRQLSLSQFCWQAEEASQTVQADHTRALNNCELVSPSKQHSCVLITRSALSKSNKTMGERKGNLKDCPWHVAQEGRAYRRAQIILCEVL